MKTRVLSYVLALLLAPSPALAYCVDLTSTLIDGLALTSSRSFSLNLANAGSNAYNSLVLMVDLTDANASITRLDMTCTSSIDGNTTDYKPQECVTVNGVCSKSVDAGIRRKDTPGSAKWRWVVSTKGAPDTECTFAAGTGSAAAGDLISVRGRICTEDMNDVMREGADALCTIVPASGETITSTDAASDVSAQLKPSTRYQISFVTSSWFDTSTSASCTAASGDPQFPGAFVYDFPTSETVMWVCARNVTSSNSAYLWECQ